MGTVKFAKLLVGTSDYRQLTVDDGLRRIHGGAGPHALKMVLTLSLGIPIWHGLVPRLRRIQAAAGWSSNCALHILTRRASPVPENSAI